MHILLYIYIRKRLFCIVCMERLMYKLFYGKCFLSIFLKNSVEFNRKCHLDIKITFEEIQHKNILTNIQRKLFKNPVIIFLHKANIYSITFIESK